MVTLVKLNLWGFNHAIFTVNTQLPDRLMISKSGLIFCEVLLSHCDLQTFMESREMSVRCRGESSDIWLKVWGLM
jgi:hypothetical protein